MSKREKVFFGILALLVVIIYGVSLFGGFVFDDRGINEHRQLLSNIQNIFQVGFYPYWTVDAGLYRPTSLLSYLFNITLLGGSAFSFHLVNLVLYFSICAAIYVLIKRLFKKEWLAYLAALIFLVMPIHTEVVANITGRLELLALFFSLLALVQFVPRSDFDAASKGPTLNWWKPGLLLLLAIGAKETAIAVIPLALVIIFIKEGRVSKEIFEKYWKPVLSLFLGAATYFVLRLIVLGPEHFLGVETSIIENPLLFADTLGRVGTSLQVLWMYVTKTFWPTNLCSDYSYNQIPVVNGFSDPRVLLGLAVLLASIISFFVFLRRKPVVSFASAIFLTSFLPVSNILFPIGTIAGERLFFFPSLGFAILLAYILSRKEVLIYLGGALIMIYTALSFMRQSVWMSEEKLFLSAVECSPMSVLSLSNAGTVYYFKGEYEKAAEYLEKSKAIKPVYSKGLNNLGLVYWKQGRFAEAEKMYHEALKQRYPYWGAVENMVLLKLMERDQNGAERWAKILAPTQ